MTITAKILWGLCIFWVSAVIIIYSIQPSAAYESPDPDTQIIRQLEDVNDNLKDIKELLGRLNDCCRNNGR